MNKNTARKKREAYLAAKKETGQPPQYRHRKSDVPKVARSAKAISLRLAI